MKILFNAILFLFIISCVVGCGKSNTPDNPEKPPITDPIVIPPPQNSSGKLIPIRLEASGRSIVFNYVENTNLLSAVTDSEGIKITFIYKNEVPASFISDYNKQVYVNDIWRDSDKKIIRISKYQDKGSITPGGEYQIDYNEQHQVVEVRYYSAKNILLKMQQLSYNASTDLIGINKDEAGAKNQQALSFDQKNGLFKHVPLAMLLLMETDNELFASINHNILSRIGTTGAINYSYEYQPDDFPKQLTLSKNNQVITFKISYKTF